MKSRFIALTCAAALCVVVYADEDESSGWAYNPGDGLSFNDHPTVSAEFSLAFDSKYMYYGLPYINEPIITPSATLTMFDWVSLGVSAMFDIGRYGRKAGYGDRSWHWIELDPEIGICHSFSSDDFEWLPTTIDFGVYYTYEEHPDSMDRYSPGDGWATPTQFVTLEIGLPDLIVEPVFTFERDIYRDNGSYLNLELGHSFAVIDGETDDDDPVLTLKPTIAQGWGDKRRVGDCDAGYLYKNNDDPLGRAGLMDTCIKLSLDWNICDWLTLSGYGAYYDFIFDRHIREAARRYEASEKWTHSYNFVCGVKLTASF